jgi:hypothetical protein
VQVRYFCSIIINSLVGNSGYVLAWSRCSPQVHPSLSNGIQHTINIPSSHRICALPLFLFMTTLPATAGDWMISKVSGEAWIVSPDASAIRAAKGMKVPDGSTFATSKNARARLERDAETIMVGPGSVISPREPSFSGTTTILQQIGQIELDVEKRNVQHFSVETPFLAAVVKGTHFTVSVSSRAADVRVDRGLVEVSDLASGQVADIAPGQRASVNAVGN